MQTPLTPCQELVDDLRSEALDAEARSHYCGYVTERVIPGMEDKHPIASMLLLMPLGMLAALSNAKAATLLAEAGAIQRAEAVALASAAMERAARAHGCHW
jgi:hypothetical protein